MHARSRFADALRGRPVDRPPVWLMRQAGRYLPEYQKVKGDTPFLALCRDVDRAAEVSLQPWRRFGVDAVILFSDILVPLSAMGLDVTIDEQGPRIGNPIRTMEDVRALRGFDPERETRYVPDILRLLRRTLRDDAALVGFSGAPFTVACYAIEGVGQRGLSTVKTLMYREPATMHALLERLADATAPYLAAQIAAGADAVQLFDTWAGELSPADYARFAAPYHARVLQRLAAGTPKILFVNGAASHLEAMERAGADVLSIDWRLDMAEARRRVGTRTLQGNVDPAVLLGPPDAIREAVLCCVGAARGGGHVLNLGHGVLKTTPPEAVGAFVDAVVKLAGSEVP